VRLSPALLAAGPSVVGATGGSGTRVVARILRRAGLFVGRELNESEDAWRLGDYSDRWVNTYLRHRDKGLPPTVEGRMLDDLSVVLADHCGPIRGDVVAWGWKEPRSIYLLPFLHRHLPELRFLHVVRDGRDMALSENQNQLRKHGGVAPIPADLPPPARSIALWSWVNSEARRYGEERLGSRYLRVRFEELCEKPLEVTARLLEFFDLDGDPAELAEEVVLPASLGRWRATDRAVVAELERVAAGVLAELGYVVGAPAR
jgi:Sulfotransferase family